MSTGRYFVTDEQEEAKNWRMLKQRDALRATATRLENELKQFAASWAEMGRLCSRSQDWTFEIDDKGIAVFNQHKTRDQIGYAPSLHFDWERIKLLIGNLQQSEEELVIANQELRALGIEAT